MITRRMWLAGLCSFAGAAGAELPEHPRLFFRAKPWGGLTLEEVRKRGAAFAADLKAEPVRSCEGAPNLAMHFLITGEEASAREAVRLMKRGYSGGEWTTTQGDEIEAIAIAYDWLSGSWAGFPAEDRTAIQELLVQAAQTTMRHLSGGASIYHTRMYAWANAVLFSGLALGGDRPEAVNFVDFGFRYYKERLLPARSHLDGAWFNAMSYGKKYMCRSVFSFLTAWHSATGENLWQSAAWPENMLMYLLYMLRPDHRFGTYGDIFDSMWGSHQGTRRVVAQAVAETRNPYGQGFLRELEEHWGRKTYDRESRWYQIFEDPSIPARPRADLPLARLFSPKALGAAVMRSGWGPNDTWIFFKCGDYGDNHGHFDQGHFEIFHKGQLALANFYGAKTTLYHNTLLVNDPQDPKDTGEQRSFSRQNHGTLASYSGDPVVHTGSILEYREMGDTTYVRGDVTPAYAPEKVKSFTRQVVFFERRVFIVFDAITVADARFRRRFLLHYPAGASVDGRRFWWTKDGGRLTVETVLPDRPKITNIALTEKDRPVPYRNFAEHYPNGRIEVEPEEYDSATTVFLHVMTPGDERTPAPDFNLRQDGSSYTLRIGGSDLVFEKSGGGFQLKKRA